MKRVIYWHERKLEWKDFEYKPKELSKPSAITSSGIEFNRNSNDIKSLNLIVIACFNKKESWRKEKEINVETLNHEQKHFDITEIFARKLRKSIKDTVFENIVVAQKAINIIHKNIMKEWDIYQDKYDAETKHSIDKEKQLEWDKKIEDELIELKNFTNNVITLEFR